MAIKSGLFQPRRQDLGAHDLRRARNPWEKDVSISNDHCDVAAGSSFVRGEWPGFELHFHHNDAALDVVFESLCQGVMEPPDGCFIGRDLPPATSSYMGWVITMPRARVTGTLTLAGRKVPLSGLGYHDHQWGSVPLVDGAMMEDGFIFDHWYWGRVHLPGHTLAYWDGQLRPELGSARHKRLVLLEEDGLVEYAKVDTTVPMINELIFLKTREQPLSGR